MFANFVSSVYDNVTSWVSVPKAAQEEDTSSGTNIDDPIIDQSKSSNIVIVESKESGQSQSSVSRFDQSQSIVTNIDVSPSNATKIKVSQPAEHIETKCVEQDSQENLIERDTFDIFNIDYDSGYDDCKTSSTVADSNTDDINKDINSTNTKSKFENISRTQDELRETIGGATIYRIEWPVTRTDKSVVQSDDRDPIKTLGATEYTTKISPHNDSDTSITIPASISKESTFSITLKSQINDVINRDDVTIQKVSDNQEATTDLSCESIFTPNESQLELNKASVTRNAKDNRLDNSVCLVSELTGEQTSYRDDEQREPRRRNADNGWNLSAGAPVFVKSYAFEYNLDHSLSNTRKTDPAPPNSSSNSNKQLLFTTPGIETERFTNRQESNDSKAPPKHEPAQQETHLQYTAHLRAKAETPSSASPGCFSSFPESADISNTLATNSNNGKDHPSCAPAIPNDIFAAPNTNGKPTDITLTTGASTVRNNEDAGILLRDGSIDSSLDTAAAEANITKRQSITAAAVQKRETSASRSIITDKSEQPTSTKVHSNAATHQQSVESPLHRSYRSTQSISHRWDTMDDAQSSSTTERRRTSISPPINNQVSSSSGFALAETTTSDSKTSDSNTSKLKTTSSLDSDFARLTSVIEKKYKSKMETTATTVTKSKKDKFVVSFNSDTSDSEESDTSTVTKNRILNKCTDLKVPNGINGESSKDDKSEKSKKKKSEKKEGDKPEKKSKKSDKKTESKLESEEAKQEKKSKSEKGDKKEKKSDKKGKKSSDKSDKPSTKSEKSDKTEKKEKKEKKSKSKESKKKEIDSDTSASCSINGELDLSSIKDGGDLDKVTEPKVKLVNSKSENAANASITLLNGHSATAETEVSEKVTQGVNENINGRNGEVIEASLSFTVSTDDVTFSENVKSNDVTVVNDMTYSVVTESSETMVTGSMESRDLKECEMISEDTASVKSDDVLAETKKESRSVEDEKIQENSTRVKDHSKEETGANVSLDLTDIAKEEKGAQSNGEQSVESFTLGLVEDKSYTIIETTDVTTNNKKRLQSSELAKDEAKHDIADPDIEKDVNDNQNDNNKSTNVKTSSESSSILLSTEENKSIKQIVGDNRESHEVEHVVSDNTEGPCVVGDNQETRSSEAVPRMGEKINSEEGGCSNDKTNATIAEDETHINKAPNGDDLNSTAPNEQETSLTKNIEVDLTAAIDQYFSSPPDPAKNNSSSHEPDKDKRSCITAAKTEHERNEKEEGKTIGSAKSSNSNDLDATTSTAKSSDNTQVAGKHGLSHITLQETCTNEANSCNSEEKQYSSQNIKSIYFAEEFSEQKSSSTGIETAVTHGEKDRDGEIAMDDASNRMNKQVQNKTQNNISSAEEKYEQILSEVTQLNGKTMTLTAQSQETSDVSSTLETSETTSKHKSLKSFSQDSYEAAMNRAFGGNNIKSRSFTEDNNISSERKHSLNSNSNTSYEENKTAIHIEKEDEVFSRPSEASNANLERFSEAKTPNKSDVSDGFEGAVSRATKTAETTDLRMSAQNEEGKDSFERTTTFLAGNRESTDELIKRILAESRGEQVPSRHRVTSHDDSGIQGRGTGSDNLRGPGDAEGLNARAVGVSGLDTTFERSVFRNSETSVRSRYDRSTLNNTDTDTLNHVTRNHDESMDTPEMSDNRQIKSPEARRGMYANEDSNDMQSMQISRMRASKSPAFSDETSEEHKRRYRSGFMQKQAAIYDDYAASFQSAANRQSHRALTSHDDDSDDDDVMSYPGRRPRMRPVEEVDFIPDEEFIPKKAEDTDQVVQERTAEIRNVVDNQNQVLTRLKSASDSFDELNDEIKQIKQAFLENSMRRDVIMDDINYEREQWEYEMAQAGSGGSDLRGSGDLYGGQGQGQYRGYRGRSLARSARGITDEDFEYEQSPANYRSIYDSSSRVTAQLDKDLESDRIGSGALQNLAITSSLSGYSGGRYSSRDDLETEGRYGKGTSYSAARSRRGRSMSVFDDREMGTLDFSDLTSSTRSKTGSRFSAANTNGVDNNDDDDEDAESYTSPNLPSYRKYDSYNASSADHSAERRSSYGARNGGLSRDTYTSAYSSGRYGGSGAMDRYGDDVASSTSGDSGSTARYGSSGAYGGGSHRTLGRSQTLDSYNYMSSSSSSALRSKYNSPASTSSFSSRFLDKVREKKASGEELKRDKGFSSRFLSGGGGASGLRSTTSFDSPYSGTSSYSATAGTSTYSSRARDVLSTSGGATGKGSQAEVDSSISGSGTEKQDGAGGDT